MHMYIQCLYGFVSRELTTYTATYSVHVLLHPILIFSVAGFAFLAGALVWPSCTEPIVSLY
jgi:hypothetical protein